MEGTHAVETNQYLSFTLDEEAFALAIGKVREVLDLSAITKVPRSSEFMRGVINLRGSVVPVVDLRLKMGMTRTERGVNSCIIIAEVDAGVNTLIGCIAESVQEVLDLEPGEIEPPPSVGTRPDAGYIRGMGKRGDRFIMVIDIDRVFSDEEAVPLPAPEPEAA